MMVTSESTAFKAISSDTSTGTIAAPPPAPDVAVMRGAAPAILPSTRTMATGTPTVPTRPRGSRTKILISSHVSDQSPFSIGHPLLSTPHSHVQTTRAARAPAFSIPDRAARQREEHILE